MEYPKRTTEETMVSGGNRERRENSRKLHVVEGGEGENYSEQD